MHYLDLSGGSKQNVVWVFETVLFELLGLWANEQVEMCGKVATKQSLVGWDIEQQRHGLHIEPWLQNLSSNLVY